MTYIIAELGTCWGARDPRARLASLEFHCEQAATAGADAVKVQMFVPDEPLFCPLDGDDARWEIWRNALLTYEHWRQIKWICESKCGVDLLASAFQFTTVDWLNDLGVKFYKVASRAALSYPYHMAKGPFIVSEGMYKTENPAHFRLQCISKYPTPIEEARWHGRNDGLSDHSGTVFPGLDAISRGARFLEVHFAVGEFSGPDQAVSLNTEQLKQLCEMRDGVARMQAA